MHEMQPIATDVHIVCLFLCLSRGSSQLHCAKTAEQIKMLFGVNTPGGPWNIVFHGGPDSFTDGKEDLLLNFGTSLISLERLKLET